jgi:quercetin dioxygenase-like cupin family protein
MRRVRIDEIDAIPVVGGELQWRPVRRTLGIEAFGINAYTANEGEVVVEEHHEAGPGAGHHEEVYVVITGRATFTVDGETFDAPVGTLVFLDDPKEVRAARAAEDGTTVLAIGGTRGEPFKVSPWEFTFAAAPAWKEKRYDEAEALVREGLEKYPGNPSLLYELACLDALQGRTEDAIQKLQTALEAQPKWKSHAAKDDDLASIRHDPRFVAAIADPPE